MAEGTDAPKAKGKKGKLKGWQYVAIIGGAGVVYYLYRQHAANTAASSTTGAGAIDPLTGQPYASEVGSAAIDPATGQPYSAELAAANAATGTGAIDPATGQPYSSEVGSQAIDPATGSTYASELSTLNAELATAANSVIGGGSGNGGQPVTVSPAAPSPGAPTPNNTALATWQAAVAVELKRIRPQLNGSQVSNIINAYLKGVPQTDPAAASWLTSAIGRVGSAPIKNGSSLPVQVARTGTTIKNVVTTAARKFVAPKPKGPTKVITKTVAKKKGPVTTKAREAELVPNPPSTDRAPLRLTPRPAR